MRASEQATRLDAPASLSAIVRRSGGLVLFCSVVALSFASNAFALKSDKNQQSNIDANYSKRVDSKTGVASDPDVTDLDGNVVITKGTIKMTGAHATIYSIPSGAKDANAGKIARTILTGKQAHMQQLHDGDCSLMTADADKIDHNPLTNIADLTGNVVVVQAGRGEFHGQHMIYNTDTGDMESGDLTSAAGRVHMVMEPGDKKPPPAANPNCTAPAPAPAKPAEKTPAPAKPAATKTATPAATKPASGAH
jgi:lipopolysaccharide export system protein LptA